jgi:hypothetical protein
MPPPVLIRDYVQIGGTGPGYYVSTWGKVRGIISDYNYAEYYSASYSLEYIKGLKSAQGSGLFRSYTAWGSLSEAPAFSAFDNDYDPALPDSKLNFGSVYNGSTSGNIDNGDRQQLINSAVTVEIQNEDGTSGTTGFNISGTAFNNPPKYQEFSGTSVYYPRILSIAKLTSLG